MGRSMHKATKGNFGGLFYWGMGMEIRDDRDECITPDGTFALAIAMVVIVLVFVAAFAFIVADFMAGQHVRP